jgi:MFS family permease
VAESALAVLREERTLRIFVIGQAISLTGLWMQQMASAWVVVGLTRATSAIATVSFVASLPIILLSMKGGAVADRFDRRRVLIATQLCASALAFGFAALLASDRLTLPVLYGLAVVSGSIMAFDLPALQAFVPELVPPARIPVAVALNSMLHHGTRLVGPAIAGALIAATSPAMAFVANGVSFFAVVASLLLIRPPPRPHGERKRSGGIGEAIRYLRGHRTVQSLIGFTALSTTFLFPIFVVFSAVFVKDVLGGSEADFGIFMSVNGAGALGGALLLLRIPPHLRGPLILAAAMTAAGAMILQSFSRSIPLAVAVQTVLTFGVSLGLGLGSTIVQVLVPPEIRGRVMAFHGIAFTALMPAAALGLGALGDAIGLRWVMRLSAATFALVAIPWLVRGGLWRRTAHHTPATHVE